MLPLYKIVENIVKGKFTHIILHRVHPIYLDTLEENVKLKIGKDLKDENNNHFKINGYYGKYLILRSDKIGTHPIGKYLI